MKNVTKLFYLLLACTVITTSSVHASVRSKLIAGAVIAPVVGAYLYAGKALWNSQLMLRDRDEYSNSFIFWSNEGEDYFCKWGKNEWVRFDDARAWAGLDQVDDGFIMTGHNQRLVDTQSARFNDALRGLLKKHPTTFWSKLAEEKK